MENGEECSRNIQLEWAEALSERGWELSGLKAWGTWGGQDRARPHATGGHAQVWFFILGTVRRGDEIWLKPLWFHNGEKLGELEEVKCDQFELSSGVGPEEKGLE